MPNPLPDHSVIERLVKFCLIEDIGDGDVTARLTPRESRIEGKIIRHCMRHCLGRRGIQSSRATTRHLNRDRMANQRWR